MVFAAVVIYIFKDEIGFVGTTDNCPVTIFEYLREKPETTCTLSHSGACYRNIDFTTSCKKLCFIARICRGRNLANKIWMNDSGTFFDVLVKNYTVHCMIFSPASIFDCNRLVIILKGVFVDVAFSVGKFHQALSKRKGRQQKDGNKNKECFFHV